MPSERRYWDTACFLAVLGKESGRFEVCEPILRAATLQGVEIVTSTLTITEVLFPKGGKKLSPQMRSMLKGFFRNPGIALVDVNRAVAESAQEHCWDFNVRPKDAVHIASALYSGVMVIETYDDKLISLSGKLGGSSPLLIRKPQPLHPTASQGDLLGTAG